MYGYPVEGNSNLLTDAMSRYGEVHNVRFRHWLHMSEVADGVRVVSMVRNQAIPHNLEVDGSYCKTGHIAPSGVPSGENVLDVVRLVNFTVIAAMNLLQQLPLVHVSCRLILKTTGLARLWSLIL